MIKLNEPRVNVYIILQYNIYGPPKRNAGTSSLIILVFRDPDYNYIYTRCMCDLGSSLSCRSALNARIRRNLQFANDVHRIAQFSTWQTRPTAAGELVRLLSHIYLHVRDTCIMIMKIVEMAVLLVVHFVD